MKYTARIFFFLILFLANFFSCTKEDKFNKEETRLLDSIQKHSYNNPDKVIPFVHQFLKKTKTEKHKRYMYGALALNYKTKNNNDSTLYYLHKGLNTCKELSDIINYKYEIGKFYEERYNYEDAMLFYKECYDLSKKENSLDELQKIEHSLKLLKNKVLESEEALFFLEENYKKEKGKSTEITDKNIRYIRKDLIEALVARKQIDKALLLIDEGIEEAKKRKNTEFLFFLNKLKAEAHLNKEEIGLAIKASDNATQYSKALKNQEFIDESNYVLAQIKEISNEPETAIFLIKKILANKEEKPVEQLANYYKLLANCYEQQDSSALAVEYYKKHDIQKESVTNKRIALIDNIDEIGLDEEILERKNQEIKTKYWNIAFIALSFLGLIFFIKTRKVQKNNQKKFDDLMVKIKASEKNNKTVKFESIASQTSDIEAQNELVIIDNKTVTIERPIDDKKVHEILLKIKSLENKKYFLRQDCTVHNMAKKLKTNTTYLSKVFNNHLGKTFSTYLNDLRINYIIVELKNNKRMRAYSAKAISEDLGYKTVDSFSKYFKRATGITPSVYIKKLQKNS